MHHTSWWIMKAFLLWSRVKWDAFSPHSYSELYRRSQGGKAWDGSGRLTDSNMRNKNMIFKKSKRTCHINTNKVTSLTNGKSYHVGLVVGGEHRETSLLTGYCKVKTKAIVPRCCDLVNNYFSSGYKSTILKLHSVYSNSTNTCTPCS